MAAKRKTTKAPAKRSSTTKVTGVLSKSALVKHLAGTSGAAVKDVKAVMAALEETIRGSMSRRGPRTFVLPGLLKITAVAVPAKKARTGINPFTGEQTTFKAKPATVRVKARPMKRLKDAALY